MARVIENNAVLSLTPSWDALVIRENALQSGGFKVISVMSPIQARFEIEMGRCGTLLMCYRLSPADTSELSRLFRRYCPGGRIIFVTETTRQERDSVDADITLPESRGAEELVKILKENQQPGTAA